MGAKVSASHSRLDRLEARLDRLERRLDRMEEREEKKTISLEHRLERIVMELKVARSDFDGHQGLDGAIARPFHQLEF